MRQGFKCCAFHVSSRCTLLNSILICYVCMVSCKCYILLYTFNLVVFDLSKQVTGYLDERQVVLTCEAQDFFPQQTLQYGS